MKRINLSILFTTFFLIIGCGGGGGKYYPPSISFNPYGITKVPFTDSAIGEEHRVTVFRQTTVDLSDDRIIEGDRYHFIQNITFQKNKYVLAFPLAKWISILAQDDNIVRKLKTPRYTIGAVAVELTHPKLKPLLAILIDQQATSHSSTLYILDSTFTPVYTEHLLGAHWISKIPSPEGDLLLVSCENRWRPDGNWIFIDGNWQYNVFKNIKKP